MFQVLKKEEIRLRQKMRENFTGKIHKRIINLRYALWERNKNLTAARRQRKHKIFAEKTNIKCKRWLKNKMKVKKPNKQKNKFIYPFKQSTAWVFHGQRYFSEYLWLWAENWLRTVVTDLNSNAESKTLRENENCAKTLENLFKAFLLSFAARSLPSDNVADVRAA